MKQDKTKVCQRCKQHLPLTAFGPDKRARTGLKCYCRECQAAKARQRWASPTGRARLRAAQQKWRASAKGDAWKTQEYHKAYYLRNRERKRAYARTYYSANRERILTRRAQTWKAYYKANRERILARNVAYRQTPSGQAARRRGSRKAKANPKWDAARRAEAAVQHALRAKKLTRPSACENCAAIRPLHGHHYLGYDLEHHLDIRWLCPKCHKAAHAAA